MHSRYDRLNNTRGWFAHLVFLFPEYPQRVLLLLPTALQFVVNFAKQLQELVTLSSTGIVGFFFLFVLVVLREVEELIG